MITQIYSIQYVSEALAVIDAGADHIGLLTGDESCPANVTMERAKEIFSAVGKRAVKVAIFMARDEQKVLEMAAELKPDILHLTDDRVFATAEFCAAAKALVPGMRVMQAVGVTGPKAIEEAKKFAKTADLILLDSFNPNISFEGADPGCVGAAGVTHDWNISKEIVKAVDVPVILAGGLDENNVAEAIRTVHPWAVDTLTRTTIVEDGVYLYKNMEKVRAFIRNAQEAGQ